MNKINLNTILKHLTGILCALFLVTFALPFCSTESSMKVAGVSSNASASISGIKIVTSGGLWGILILVSLVAIVLASYLPQLVDYKKMICLAASGVLILSIFMVVGTVAGATASADSASSKVDVKTSYLIGFWIEIIDAILLLGLSVINFFNLKGNPVFDAVQAANEASETTNGSATAINFSEQLSNIKEKVSSVAQNVGESVSNVTSNMSTGNNNSNVVTKAPQKATVKKADPDYVMENIKKLHEMKESGILTEEEFAEKKKEFLERM